MSKELFEHNPRKLIEAAKAGDATAFGNLYHQYLTPVFRYVYVRVKNRQEADDLTQTVFLKAYQGLARYADKGQDPLAYFFTIARNTVIDHWRKMKDYLIEPKDGEEFETMFEQIADSEPLPEQLFERQENKEVIQEGLKTLTGEQRTVVELKFLNDWSNTEIARHIKKSEEAVRQLQCRALKRLRVFLVP